MMTFQRTYFQGEIYLDTSLIVVFYRDSEDKPDYCKFRQPTWNTTGHPHCDRDRWRRREERVRGRRRLEEGEEGRKRPRRLERK